MLIGSVDLVPLFRMVYIEGRLGSYKTLFSVALAKHFLDLGVVDKVVANIPVLFAANMVDGQESSGSPGLTTACGVVPALCAPGSNLSRCAIIIDEIAEFIDSRNYKKNNLDLLKYPRKVENLLFFPCINPPDRRARQLCVRLVFDWRFIKLLCFEWSYNVGLQDRKAKTGSGKIWLFDPQSYFPLFSSRSTPHKEVTQSIWDAYAQTLAGSDALVTSSILVR